jgi:hypothetical protein
LLLGETPDRKNACSILKVAFRKNYEVKNFPTALLAGLL